MLTCVWQRARCMRCLYYPLFILLLMIVFPCLNRSLGRNLFTYSIASSVNPPRELSSLTPFFASIITSSFVHSRFGQRYPNIRGFRQYLLVFGLKQYNLLSKEFSLHLPIFIVSVLGERHFINNWFMGVRNIYENKTLNTDCTCVCVRNALSVSKSFVWVCIL